MKSSIKLAVIIVLLFITFLSMELMGTVIKITITGTGRVDTLIYPNGTWKTKCDGSSSDECTFTNIIVPEQ
jgi:hypothetical protein